MDVKSMMNAPGEGHHFSEIRPEFPDMQSTVIPQKTAPASTGEAYEANNSIIIGHRRSLSHDTPGANYSVPPSPVDSTQSKSVSFHVLCPQSPDTPARLPLRLNIRPHDTTESLMSTIRNFHGLWDTPGTKILSISLEDQHGNTIIPRFENFEHEMAVFVRAMMDNTTPSLPLSHGARTNGSPITATRPIGSFADHPSHNPRYSPVFPGMNSGFNSTHTHEASATNFGKHVPQFSHMVSGRPELHLSTRDQIPSLPDHRRSRDGDSGEVYSDSEDGPASTAGSKKEIVSAEISLDNIVEGARRKRVNKGFESSQLPLFAPSQIPLAPSYNSISPIRQGALTDGGHSLIQPSPSTMANMYSLQSPYGARAAPSLAFSAQHSPMLNYPMGGFSSSRRATEGFPLSTPRGILPTPDMTIASHISDEDVAIQLMRLGDTSNISRSNRNSASTVEELNAQDIAHSSESETDEENTHDHHQRKKIKVQMPGLAPYAAEGPQDTDYSSHNDDANDGSFGERGSHPQQIKPKSRPRPLVSKIGSGIAKRPMKPGKIAPPKKSKIITLSTHPTGFASPNSMSAHSRKPSLASTINFSTAGSVGTGEDLSAMPRCQRCRKSKKGCDRKRPCGRCKEAGIGPEGCVSEEEGNGRKGRYGRQVGTSSKSASKKAMPPPTSIPQASPTSAPPLALMPEQIMSMVGSADGPLPLDRKRKREDEQIEA